MALAGLQLVLPRKESRHFARVSGRRWSPQRNDIVISKDGVQTAGQNRSPGLALMADHFQLAITQGSRLLASVGHRLDAFLGNRVSSLPQLEQAWCDAAYWMHEGFAEAIDTISVAKLETSLEVLMSAESTSLSNARLRHALRAFNRLMPNQRIFSDSSQTVEDFGKAVAQTRSPVLPATFPTLTIEASDPPPAI